MKVLSLFNGISCGMVALQRAGIPVERYVSYEIDKLANQITSKHFPEIEQYGDVRDADFSEYEDFDLVMGGFPCQDLSSMKQKRQLLKGERSSLFYVLVDAIKTIKPKYFLVENVWSMPKATRETISATLGVTPIHIDSALVSAQRRKRLYWTNIPVDDLPKDKGILLKDILEDDPDDYFYFTESTYASMEKQKERVKRKGLRYNFEPIKPPYEVKATCVDASYHKGFDGRRTMIESLVGEIRMLTPLECERLQTLPDGYTEGLSNRQRYKTIGNGWTVDVIAHILNYCSKS